MIVYKPLSPPSHHEKWKLACLQSPKSYTFDIVREISERIVRYSFSLNNINILYILDVRFVLLCYKTPWLNKVPKIISLQKVMMTSLLLQLDDLSILEVCVMLGQELAFDIFLKSPIIKLLIHTMLSMKKELRRKLLRRSERNSMMKSPSKWLSNSSIVTTSIYKYLLH